MKILKKSLMLMIIPGFILTYTPPPQKKALSAPRYFTGPNFFPTIIINDILLFIKNNRSLPPPPYKENL